MKKIYCVLIVSLENSVITDNNKLAILVLSSNDLEPVTQDKKPSDSNIKHSILFKSQRSETPFLSHFRIRIQPAFVRNRKNIKLRSP